MYANGDFAKFREADKIIAYLKDPSGHTDINASLKRKLHLYTQIYSLKLEFKQNSYIHGILVKVNGLNPRAATNAINETEYIFGKVNKIDAAFEKTFLLEASRKNLELAYRTKDNNKINKALEVHYKIVGEELDETELPDFSKIESHTYNIVMAPEISDMIKNMLSQGAINLSNTIPRTMVERALENTEDANVIDNDGE